MLQFKWANRDVSHSEMITAVPDATSKIMFPPTLSWTYAKETPTTAFAPARRASLFNSSRAIFRVSRKTSCTTFDRPPTKSRTDTITSLNTFIPKTHSAVMISNRRSMFKSGAVSVVNTTWNFVPNSSVHRESRNFEATCSSRRPSFAAQAVQRRLIKSASSKPSFSHMKQRKLFSQ